MQDTTDPEEELAAELIECINCEARYSILLGDDFLIEEARFCPFCSEYIIRE